MKPKHYLVVDFEATCCDKRSIQRGEMEIIEIGAVLVRAEQLDVVSEFCAFIKPVRKPTLTSFCTELTTIQQADVDGAEGFVSVLTRFLEWVVPFDDALFCSWGDYDRKQLNQDCRYHKQPEPFSQHLNLKQEFTGQNRLPRRYGMAGALALAKLPLSGTHHRGIDDARNIAKLLPFIVGDQRVKARR